METYEPLKPSEIQRDATTGRFERKGTLAKTAKKTGLKKKPDDIKREADGKFGKGHGGAREGAGRKKGVPNRLTVALKDAILAAGERAGGKEGLTGYLTMLARDNSSAYAGLLAKVLPTTLSTSESNGGPNVELRFVREIVYPDGHRHIEGVTPKQLTGPPAPDASGT